MSIQMSRLTIHFESLERNKNLAIQTPERQFDSLHPLFKAMVDQQRSDLLPCFSSPLASHPFVESFNQKAEAIVQKTLEAMGRGAINDFISFCEQELNAPIFFKQEKIDLLIASFHILCQKYSLKICEKKEQIVLDFEGLLFLDRELKKILVDQDKKGEESSLFNPWLPFHQTIPFEEKVLFALRTMALKEGDVLRILEPGNNDQSTPMVVAELISAILDYSLKNNLRLVIQVLVIGKGGHATTQLFPQFAEIVDGKTFSGTLESESLGETLYRSLKEKGIEARYDVEHFSEVPTDFVEIMLARGSTNTGENVDEASAVYDREKIKPDHVFIASATPGSLRQAQSFAQRYSFDSSDPLAKKRYRALFAIPPTKHPDFVSRALNDHQAVTELYACLGEMTRLFAYAFNLDLPFIPASPIPLEYLERLYQVYDLLSGTSSIEISKKQSIHTLLTFFHGNFQFMEKSIPWNKEKALQEEATREAMKKMTSLYRLKTDLTASIELYRGLVKKPVDEKTKKTLRVFSALFEKSMDKTSTPKERKSCLRLMAAFRKKLEVVED